MSTLASLLVKLGLDAADFHKGVAGVERGAGQLVGTLGKIGGAAAVGGIAVAGAAVVAVGKMAWDAAVEMDGAMDTLAIKTGATGDKLAGLGDDFKAVFTSIPTDAATASDAVAELATRTGATGNPLQELSKSVIQMSKLTGGSAAKNAALYARVMGDWSIPVEEGSAALDKLFVASQKTGVPMDSLMQKVVQFGSPLRLMGFELEDSAALFAKWEKEGVNSELVMGSLRIAAGKFAKDGKPLRESLLGTFDAIRKNKDETAALALGMEVFGARAGPDMVKAIREGRFAIDDLVGAMGGAQGAIKATADATADWPEKWQTLKNKVSVALAPLGGTLLDIANKAMDIAKAIGETGVKSQESYDALASLFGEDLAGKIQAVLGPAQDFAKAAWSIGSAIATHGLNSPQALAALTSAFDANTAGRIQDIGTEIGKIADKVGQAPANAFGDVLRTFKTEIPQEIFEGKETIKTYLADLKQFLGLAPDVSGWSGIAGRFRDIAAAINSASDALTKWIDKMNGGSTGPLFNPGAIPQIPGIPGYTPPAQTPGTGGRNFAAGTNFAPGGWSLVGERGPELVNLPRGAQVFPAGQTAAMLRGGGEPLSSNYTISIGAIYAPGGNVEQVRSAAHEGVTEAARALGLI